MALSKKHQKFVAEYCIDCNATAAAIAAGYSERSARTTASRLLTKDDIKKAVDEGIQEKLDRCGVRADRILDEISRLAYSDMKDFYEEDAVGEAAVIPIMRLNRRQSSAIQEMTFETYFIGEGENAIPAKRVKFKLADKARALDLLARHKKLLTDKNELTISDPLADFLSYCKQKHDANPDEPK